MTNIEILDNDSNFHRNRVDDQGSLPFAKKNSSSQQNFDILTQKDDHKLTIVYFLLNSLEYAYITILTTQS